MTKATILLAQNAHTQGNSTKRHLESAGYAVVWAGSGVAALAAAKRQAVDLILIDVALPDIEGSDLCRRFRAREAMQSVPIILLAGNGYTPVRSAGNNGGPDDFLVKPYSEGELDARIAVMLRKRTAGRQPEASAAPALLPQPVMTGGQVKQPTPERTVVPQQEPGPAPAAEPKSDVLQQVERNTDQQPAQAAAKPPDAVMGEEVVDHETGLFSRRQFDTMFSKEFKRVVRFKQQMSCMMIDLEGGKLGRQADKSTLKAIVQLIQHTIREVDTAAWWSGEALVVLLPNTMKNDAVQAAARVLDAVAIHPFSWDDSTKVTMSIGVAGLPDRKIDTAQKLIEAAAAACRRAGEFMTP
jgi:diguanylate cyclase (GGDEF)-like protein